MGGLYYDREVYGSSSDSDSYSSKSSIVMNNNKLDDCMLPKYNDKLTSKAKYPIIIVLDVTGSNKTFANIVYDKLPMFYGQIMDQGYLDDIEISICAVGDTNSDLYPLQVGQFKKGIDIEEELKKLVLEGHGGGSGEESYEKMANYLLNSLEYSRDSKPIMFFLGDEKPYDNISGEEEILYGVGNGKGIATKEIFKKLNEKLDNRVYMMLNKYQGNIDFIEMSDTIKVWEELLEKEHLILVDENKSIVDLMLGIIAINYRARSLNNYIIDMKNRGQDNKRIENVEKSLIKLSNTFDIVMVLNGNIAKSKDIKVSVRSERL